MQKNTGKTTNLLMAVVYMLFMISFAVIVVLNFKPLYYSDIDRLGIEADSGMTKEDIKENYKTLIDYNSMFCYEDLDFPDLAMSENGKTHFKEVKDIFVALQYLCIISFFLLVLGTSWKSHLKEAGYLKYAGIFTLVIPSLLGSLVALNWNQFFVTMHHILFKNDYWIFDPATDPVITILPDAFFMHCAIAIISLVILFSVLCLIAYHYCHKRWTASQTEA